MHLISKLIIGTPHVSSQVENKYYRCSTLVGSITVTRESLAALFHKSELDLSRQNVIFAIYPSIYLGQVTNQSHY